jgi:hypothetical protein
MGVSTRYLQGLFELQMQQNNDKIIYSQNPKLQLNFNEDNMPTTIHLIFERKLTSYTLFLFCC